jgi:hypothetical protein
MIGVRVAQRDNSKRVLAKTKAASFRSLAHAGAAIRLTARRSIRTRKKASPPGTPPHTRKGAFRRAILYAVEKKEQRVVIGPSLDLISSIGREHEYGGRIRARNTRRTIRRLGGGGEIVLHPRGKPTRDLAGQVVHVVYTKLITQAQVDRANRINKQLYGPEMLDSELPPRPTMGPALDRNRPRLPKLWHNSVK